MTALVGFLMDVERFYPLEAFRPFRLERGSARNAQGGVAEKPKGLCVTLSLHQDTAACDLQALFAPEAVGQHISRRAEAPLELVRPHALAGDLWLAVLPEVGNFDVGGAVLFLAVLQAADHPQPVRREVLFFGVVVYGVVLAGRFLFGFIHAMFSENPLVSVGVGATVQLRSEADVVARLTAGEADEFAGFEIHGKAGLAVVVEGAEACHALFFIFGFLHELAVFLFIIRQFVEVYFVHACPPSQKSCGPQGCYPAARTGSVGGCGVRTVHRPCRLRLRSPGRQSVRLRAVLPPPPQVPWRPRS